MDQGGYSVAKRPGTSSFDRREDTSAVHNKTPARIERGREWSAQLSDAKLDYLRRRSRPVPKMPAPKRNMEAGSGV